MLLRSTYSQSSGFTIIEIVIVIAILGVIMALGLFMSMDSYRGTLSRSEVTTIVSMLEKARSRSMANIDQNTWGFCYTNNTYIVFEGSACTQGLTSNEEIAASGGAVISGLSAANPVVFAQLSGTTTPVTFTVAQNGRTSTLQLNNEGTIIW